MLYFNCGYTAVLLSVRHVSSRAVSWSVVCDCGISSLVCVFWHDLYWSYFLAPNDPYPKLNLLLQATPHN